MNALELIRNSDTNELRESMNAVSKFQEMVKTTLKQGHDFDTIPGTYKPTLLKPGAEKILMIMGITSEYDVMEKIEDWNKGIFAYTVKCTLSKNGLKITEGLGSCNSKEDKYRYRWVYPEKAPIGTDFENAISNEYGKIRVDNDEIFSQVNTLLKMAKKRAQVDAVLTVASLSDIFTQDVEDMKQFIQSEQIDTMNDGDAEKIIITFGRHKGKNLGEIYAEAPSYIDWLKGNAKEERIRVACRKVLGEVEEVVNEVVDEGEYTQYFEFSEEDLPFA